MVDGSTPINRSGHQPSASPAEVTGAETGTAPAPAGAMDAGDDGELTRRTLLGIRWAWMTNGSVIALQLVYQVFINRLLDPVAFGIMAVALLSLRFSQFFADMGVGVALVQKPEIDEDDLRASFTSSVVLGVTVFALLWVLAPGIASIFNEPDAAPILRATGGSVIFLALGLTGQAVLSRELRFVELGVIHVLSYALAFLIVGLGAALLDFGVWSLVFAHLTASFTSTILTYTRVRHTLRPAWNWTRLRQLYSYGTRSSGYSLLVFVGTSLDTAAVGRFTTTALLGHYSRAYYLTNLPASYLTNSLADVLFPGFSRIQGDTARMARVYITSIRVAGFLLLPLCAGMAAAAPEVVRVAIGPQWDEAISVLPILAVAMCFYVMSHFAGTVCEARAELNKLLAIQISFLLIFALFLLGARGGTLLAYGAALAAAEWVRLVLFAFGMRHILGVRLLDSVRAYLPGATTALLAAGFILVARRFFVPLGVPALPLLLVEIAIGLLALLVGLRLPVSRAVRDDAHARLATAGVLDKQYVGRPLRLLLST